MNNRKEEFFSLIKDFEKHGVLKNFIIIGSWAKVIYMENYPIKKALLNTVDIDFTLIDPKGSFEVSVNRILIKNEYRPEHTVFSKSITYFPDSENKQLKIDFLCPFKRNVLEPKNVKGLNIIVTPLTYQDILVNNSIELPYLGISIKVPSPEVWAIHKIAISRLRKGSSINENMKAKKDLVDTEALVDYFGRKVLDNYAEENFSGKFLKLYKLGMKKFSEPEYINENELDKGMEF